MIRLASPAERAFVCKSWVQSFGSSPWADSMATPLEVKRNRLADAYYRGHNALVDRLLARPGCVVRVAERDGIAVAFLVAEPSRGVVHYAYTKTLYRGEGIQHELAGALWEQPAVYTHKTHAVDAARVPRLWRYDPYPAMGG